MDRRVTQPKRVTSPTWGPPPPCKQALNFKKVIFRNMRTTRKQFPVNWLTSGRLAFTIQGAKERRSQQKWRPKWRDDVEGL